MSESLSLRKSNKGGLQNSPLSSSCESTIEPFHHVLQLAAEVINRVRHFSPPDSAATERGRGIRHI